MWLWLAIIGNFVLIVVLFRQHIRLTELHNQLCSVHDASRAKFSSRIDDLEQWLGYEIIDASCVKLSSRIDNLERRLGYEELERRLNEAVIWKKEDRDKQLGNLFPRVANLETSVNGLKNGIELVFEANNLKNWNSLTDEERRKALISEKQWP